MTPHAKPEPSPLAPPAFVLLHSHAQLSLASDPLLLPPEQVLAFSDAFALAGALARLHDDETARVQAAAAAGYARGRAEGLAQGQDEARQTAERTLAAATQRLAQQAAAEAEAIEQQVVVLAVLIVRRITAGLPPETVLAALARQALAQLFMHRPLAAGPPEPGAITVGADAGLHCQLRLPPALLAGVQTQLGDTPGMALLADDTLGGLDCVLDTPNGRLLAGLDSQLARIQAQLTPPRPSPAARAAPRSPTR